MHTISYLFGVLFKGIETISDVRDALAKKVHIARKHIFVVNKEEGKILKDNTGIAKLIDRPFEVMIANQNRTLVSGCCKMSCGHFTRKFLCYEDFEKELYDMCLHNIKLIFEFWKRFRVKHFNFIL